MKLFSSGLAALRVALTLIAAALTGCGGSALPRAAKAPAPAPAWATRVPDRCHAGLSGPTLNPGDAIRAAQADALGRAAEALGVRIVSELKDDGAQVAVRTVHSTREQLSRVRIALVQAQVGRHAGDLSERVVHALACEPGVSVEGGAPRLPSWLVDPRAVAAPGRSCAVGLAGPTLDPHEQAPIAERDAARALAATRRVLVEREAIDTDESSFVIVKSDVAVSDTDVEEMASRLEVVGTWDDARGEGPLGLPGVRYAVACAAF
jgi:hypothetical protein